ncbi:unnamed protein product [Rotaria sp. Silwood2]|nr:unnamed protein product [Rotaria sp. Silwood2]CAF4165670.1 unnamed protein product [Rotaria sp. Silwood2]CAF4196466.1 unnamed protein product [Rotaria sp. Silwood2]CAF4317093.1 unnamed protein product [Rotaria sp. Silwood2]
MHEADTKYSWNLNYSSIAVMWRANAIHECQHGWRKIITTATKYGVPIPGLSTALNFYDEYHAKGLPANIIQAQLKLFGKHKYKLLGSHVEHTGTDWTDYGSNVTAST